MTNTVTYSDYSKNIIPQNPQKCKGGCRLFEIRDLMRHFAGQTVDGALLGADRPVTLPRFDYVAPWRSADGQVEIDAWGINGEVWLVEVKWRVKAASRQEVQEFYEAARTLPHDRLWFISRSGFSATAMRLARERGILVSDGESLDRLARLVRTRQGGIRQQMLVADCRFGPVAHNPKSATSLGQKVEAVHGFVLRLVRVATARSGNSQKGSRAFPWIKFGQPA